MSEKMSCKNTIRFALTFLVLLLVSCSVFASGKNKRIERIVSQEQFDAFVKEVNNGLTKHVKLSGGKYVLNTTMRVSAPLEITGRGAVITWANDVYSRKDAVKNTPTHYVCKLKNKLSLYCLFLDDYDNIIDIAQSVNPETAVNMVPTIATQDHKEKGTEVKIPLTDYTITLANKKFKKSFGYFDCGWQKIAFELLSADNSHLYCKTLEYRQPGNYNYDSIFYHKPIRYVIYNAEPKAGAIFYTDDEIYIPNNISKVTCVNSDVYGVNTPSIVTNSNKFVLNGISFKNFNGIHAELKEFSEFRIEKCSFRNTLGYALKIDNHSKNKGTVSVKQCSFYDSSLTAFSIVNYTGANSNGLFCFENNIVSRYPQGKVMYKNTINAVGINGDAFLKKNVIYNTCRDHIFCGSGNILVSGNVCFNDDVFNTNVLRNYSSDWGIVYCNHLFSDTQKALSNTISKIVLRNNFLCSAYAYGGDARGIFIDDGRGDVICEGNVILNMQWYSMDSRDVKLIDAASIRNRYDGNIVSTRYRLVGGKDVKGENVPVLNENILLCPMKNQKHNVNIKSDDIQLDYDTSVFCMDKKITVSQKVYELLRKKPVWEEIKRLGCLRNGKNDSRYNRKK